MTRPGALLLHGLGGCSFHWEGAARLLGDAIAPDAPYHGGRPAEGELSFPAAAADAIAQADAAGLERFVAAGASMGAATAMTIAALFPDRVAGLVLVSPAWLDTPFPPNLDRLRKLGRRMQAKGLHHAWQVVGALAPVDGWEASAVAAYRARFMAFDAAATASAMQELPGVLPLCDGVRVDGPRVVLTWPDDPIHPERLAAEVADAVGAPGAHVVPRPQGYAAEQAFLADVVARVQAGGEWAPAQRARIVAV